jgi:hypothetical protein
MSLNNIPKYPEIMPGYKGATVRCGCDEELQQGAYPTPETVTNWPQVDKNKTYGLQTLPRKPWWTLQPKWLMALFLFGIPALIWAVFALSGGAK